MISRTATVLISLFILTGSIAAFLPQSFSQSIKQSPVEILPTQPHAQNLSCEASIPTSNGVMLIYQMSGPINLDNAGNQVRSTSADLALKLTVKKRNSSGQVQTLLVNTGLKNFEIIAPDADYSRLPFTGSFRGLPNDGAGLYSAIASRYGLYASLRPPNNKPAQLQIVHYLSPNQPVRSAPGICRLSS